MKIFFRFIPVGGFVAACESPLILLAFSWLSPGTYMGAVVDHFLIRIIFFLLRRSFLFFIYYHLEYVSNLDDDRH